MVRSIEVGGENASGLTEDPVSYPSLQVDIAATKYASIEANT
jgi:hypothetical protein